MNKRFLSTLLTGAIFLAATSMFVSCKDYDDDIRNLQAQIDKAALKTELDALQATLNNVSSTASSALSKAEQGLKDAAAAQNAADAAAAAAKKAQETADAAGAKAAQAIENAAKAQQTADAGVAAAAAAQAAADAAQITADAAKAIAEAAATKEELAAAKTELTSLANKAQATADAAKALAEAAATKAELEEVNKTLTAAAAAAQETADAAKALAEAAATKAEFDEAVTKFTEAVKKAQATADEAKTLAEAAATKEELTAAKTELQKFAQDVADQAEAAAKAEAKAVAEKAAQDLADAIDAQKTYTDDAIADAVETAKATIEDKLKDYATNATVNEMAQELKDRLTTLETLVMGTDDPTIFANLVEVVNGYKTTLSDLFKAVTSVELIATYTGYAPGVTTFQSSVVDIQGGRNNAFNLNFKFGKMLEDSKFGDKETESLFEDADEIIEYFAGKDIRAKQAILVRVNPTNATFTKEQVKFFDSKGRNLDEIITIGEPYRYEGLITRSYQTRGSETAESGLWVIPVSVAENVEMEDFNGVTFDGREYDEDGNVEYEGRQILYAVAINNVADPAAAEDDAARYVASTYDLAASYSPFRPSTHLDYMVGDGWVSQYHNRWLETRNSQNPRYGDEIAVIQSKDQYEAWTKLSPELCWKMNISDAEKEAGMFIPTSEAKVFDVEGDEAANAEYDLTDDRFYNNFYQIKSLGEEITLELPAPLKETVEYWYVTYDFEANAVESAPSEWEAWQSYRKQIDGIYTMTKGADQLNIVIKAPTALGDVIGFRVFAVNYDGTLLDPDGKAFYVKVGEVEPLTVDVEAEFNAVKQSANMYNSLIYDENTTVENGFNVGIVEVNQKFESLKFNAAGINAYGYRTVYDFDDEIIRSIDESSSVPVYYAILDKDGKLATDWADIAYVKVGVAGQYLNRILDGATLDLGTIIRQQRTDANDRSIYELNLTATKVMPTEGVDGITWKNGYEFAKEIYVKPVRSNYLATGWHAYDSWFRWNNGSYLMFNDVTNPVWNNSNQFAYSGMRQMKDYIYSGLIENDADYAHEFEFIDLPTGLNNGAPEAMNYVTTTATSGNTLTGGNTIVNVKTAAIGNEYNYNLNFIYKNISLTKDEDGDWNTDYDYPVTVWTKPTTFKNAIDLLTYKWQYAYADKKYNNQLYVLWSTVKDGRSVKLYVSKKAAAESNEATDFQAIEGDITQYFESTITDANKVLAENVGLTPYEFDANRYAFDNNETLGVLENAITVELVEGTAAATYIEAVEGGTTANFQVKKLGGAADPTADKAGKIKLTGYDVFGKAHTWEIPVTIKFNL